MILGGLLMAVLQLATPPLVDAQTVVPEARLDIKYATADNIAHTVLYPVARCFLRPEVAAMLRAAQGYISAQRPGVRLLLKDCYRPVRAQRRLFAAVRGTHRQGYVADPNSLNGSVHTYGAAVDLTLMDDATGQELDMGTPFDFLGPLAEPRREADFAARGTLSAQHIANRKLLRAAMVQGGHFRAIPNEWWHFDAWQGMALRSRYDRLDVPLDAL